MNRFLSIRKMALVILTLGVGLGLASPAQAQIVPHKEKCSGTINVSELISDPVALQEWSGSGKATHMGKYTQTGSHKVNLVIGEIFDGEFTSIAADGSIASGIFFGSFTINDDGSVSYSVTAVWLEGTGRFEGLYGSGNVQAKATGVAPGSTFHYVTDAFWDLP